MNYQETCDYLYSQLPMYERQGNDGYKEGLGNTRTLDEHFGHPHRQYATIHVAGTNGKGSVAHTIAAVLQSCGYRVGLYTSPHLVDFAERIRINGQPVSHEYVVDFVEREHAFFEPLRPSFFEVTTAMAFKYFADSHVDIAVVEVGLGGRLDCTNIITPVVSVITNISYDHTQLLGNTLAQIAAEKAGIIKAGVPVVIGETNKETRPVFEEYARRQGAPIRFAQDAPEVTFATARDAGGTNYHTAHMGELAGDLGGTCQARNLNTVLAAIQVLAQQGFLVLEDATNGDRLCQEVTEGIAHVAANTGLRGRWQVVQQIPKVVCDTGHNVGAWQYLSNQLRNAVCRQLHMVFGMVGDKDVDGVLALLPNEATYYFTRADNHRAMDQQQLKQKAQTHGLRGEAYPTVAEAYKAALARAGRDDLIFVGGSSYVVGDFLKTVGTTHSH